MASSMLNSVGAAHLGADPAWRDEDHRTKKPAIALHGVTPARTIRRS
jgi:hypothetical protein